jgi:ribosomal protein S18 acetylase RimI-like enzyme
MVDIYAMVEDDFRRIDEAGLNAWPGLQQILLDGWVLRFSNGYTLRANSVNVLYPSRLDITRKIEMCEALYGEKQLVPAFRITPAAVAEGLDDLLEGRGYTRGGDSLVLVLDSIDPSRPENGISLVTYEHVEDWIALFSRFKRVELESQKTHREIVSLVAAGRTLVSIHSEGEAVACAMGVLDQGLFGIYDVVVDPERRNQGFGRNLMGELLHWAVRHGATRSYLLVDADNAPALHLYTQLGFRKLYSYWYRKRPALVGTVAGTVANT